MKCKAIVLGGLVLLWVSGVWADTLILKGDRKFKGKVLQETEKSVQIETVEGAVLTFPRAQVEKIEKDAPEPKPADTAAPATTVPAGAATLDALQESVAALRSEVAACRKENEKLAKEVEGLKGLKEQVEKLAEGMSEVSTRASRLPPKRGDFAGSKDRSKFKLVNCRVERAGDEWMVRGFIKNTGSSPGVWSRVITQLRDENGAILHKNDINPTFVPSGSHETRDKSVLSPGEEFEFYSYVPYGKWASSRYSMGIEEDRKPPGGLTIADQVTLDLPKAAGGNTILLKLEIPPKDEQEKEVGGDKPTPGLPRRVGDDK